MNNLRYIDRVDWVLNIDIDLLRYKKLLTMYYFQKFYNI